MTGSVERRADGPCLPDARGMPVRRRGRMGQDGERRFADSVKTMVSGEAGFVVKMSFQTSLIGRNDYVAYPPQCSLSAKNIFHFQKENFALPRQKHRQHHANGR
ncbi:hypothetical protein [Janthinobacterium sp. SUN026]|uniref:hypothetical protein n=2 Tax=unclassified Janthinobacterium TaxID=2610881 RepID=UPI0025B1E846|nr:hypothetical protein [Janthinobacterium sp. SUN026]